MRYDEQRDTVVIEDHLGSEKEYAVEALFDMEEKLYALLRDRDNDTIVLRVEDEGEDQYVVGIFDPQEKENILDAYQIAIEAASDEE
ncbi:hypothetical protein GCM10008967_20020 [Bacillus carboniphilus]|uniref:DUF1292 domain-containing protein n=1 Tax=Bacillus carboniphilus TaxID=86663 RepID=A0ABP3FXY2_9BACI